MVAASVMDFEPEKIPTFVWANKAGMRPESLDEIEVRGDITAIQIRQKSLNLDGMSGTIEKGAKIGY
jgi:hypothetical protein